MIVIVNVLAITLLLILELMKSVLYLNTIRVNELFRRLVCHDLLLFQLVVILLYCLVVSFSGINRDSIRYMFGLSLFLPIVYVFQEYNYRRGVNKDGPNKR